MICMPAPVGAGGISAPCVGAGRTKGADAHILGRFRYWRGRNVKSQRFRWGGRKRGCLDFGEIWGRCVGSRVDAFHGVGSRARAFEVMPQHGGLPSWGEEGIEHNEATKKYRAQLWEGGASKKGSWRDMKPVVQMDYEALLSSEIPKRPARKLPKGVHWCYRPKAYLARVGRFLDGECHRGSGTPPPPSRASGMPFLTFPVASRAGPPRRATSSRTPLHATRPRGFHLTH